MLSFGSFPRDIRTKLIIHRMPIHFSEVLSFWRFDQLAWNAADSRVLAAFCSFYILELVNEMYTVNVHCVLKLTDNTLNKYNIHRVHIYI